MSLPDGARVSVLVLALSAAGLVAIANREDYRGEAYLDDAKVATLGFGETQGVKLGQKTTPRKALTQLGKRADQYADGVRACVKVEAHQYEFDSWVGLAYNVGVGAFCRSSPNPATNPYLIDLINSRRYTEACDRFLEFNKYRDPATGKLVPSPGLTKFRQEERARCLGEVH